MSTPPPSAAAVSSPDDPAMTTAKSPSEAGQKEHEMSNLDLATAVVAREGHYAFAYCRSGAIQTVLRALNVADEVRAEAAALAADFPADAEPEAHPSQP